MKTFEAYKPEFYGLLIAVGSLNLWYLLCLTAEKSVIPASSDYVIKALIAVGSVLLGAFLAFKYRQYEDAVQLKKDRINAINTALFTLHRQINAISCIKKDLDYYETAFDKLFILPANKYPDYSRLVIDIPSLHFLIEKNKPQFLLDLSIEQECFDQALISIEQRNDHYLKCVDPIINGRNIDEDSFPSELAKELLGEYNYDVTCTLTRTMYDHIYQTYDSLIEIDKRFNEVAVDVFSEAKFVSLQKT
ncbi:MAG: hypothetical protein HAW67_02045 [Endozoicomonadaceae bacterium]|nr:hypothetical protein [Endozoicomonadaceae bacterium]